MPTIIDIEKLAKIYSDVRAQRIALVKDANEKIEQIQREALKLLRPLVAREAEKHKALYDAVDAAPELFEKPRTQIFHGIKVGFTKGRGGIDWDDDDDVVRRIRKLYPDDAGDLYLHITEKPNRETLGALPVEALKKLGCTVESTGDTVMIKPTDTTMDKIARALLKTAMDESKAEK